jgi:Methylamine utilisation protein MauE
MDETFSDHLSHAIQIALGLVFVTAALAKLRSPHTFVQTVGAYRLLRDWMVAPVAVGVIGAELFLAVAFMSGSLLGFALPLALFMLGLFLFAVAVNLRRGRHIPCGCFGNRHDEISSKDLVRIVILLSGGLSLVVLNVGFGTRALTISSVTALGTDAVAYVVQLSAIASFLIVLGIWLLYVPDVVAALGGMRRIGRRIDDDAGKEVEPV